MTLEGLVSVFRSMGFPAVYHHFEEGHSPAPPFLVYLFSESENFGADNQVYHQGLYVLLELYTEQKDLESEGIVEETLSYHSLYFEKVETYIETEKLYQVVYHLVI